jgi:dihydrofolate reductase
MPWYLPEDLKHFKAVTRDATVVMGRRTWDSLPLRSKPLPNRENLVLTRHHDWSAVGARSVFDLRSALLSTKPLWVIGGGQVYEAALPFADRICETLIDAEMPGDTTAPHLGGEWFLHDEGDWLTSVQGLRYRFLDWRRST